MNLKSVTRSIRRFYRPILATLLAILGLLTAIWMLALEPRATARIEVRPVDDDDYSVAAQERLLRSAEILQPVIEQFNLYGSRSSNGASPWIADLQVQRLAQSIEVREIPNTSLLEVSFYHRDSKFASNVTDTIVAVYSEYRLSQQKRRIDDEFAKLKSDVERTRTQVEFFRQELAELKEREGIIDPDPEHDITIEVGVDQNSIAAYSAAKSRFLNEKKILDAGVMKYSTERLEQGDYLEPVRIWDSAKPSMHADFRRLRRRFVN